MSDIVDIKKSRHNTKPTLDLDRLQREYELDTSRSLTEIGQCFGIAESTIRYHAKKHGWQRQRLARQISERVTEKLLQTDITKDLITDAMIDAAAKTGAMVVTKHREQLERLRAITAALTTKLELTLKGEYKSIHERKTKRGTIQHLDFLSANESLNDALLKLSRTMSLLIELERKAYNIDDDTPPDELTYEARLKRLAEYDAHKEAS